MNRIIGNSIWKLFSQQQKQEPTFQSPPNRNLSQGFVECVIGGGMHTKLVIKTECPTNIMSRALFRRLRAEKHTFFTADMIPSKIGNLEFFGQFTSKIEANGKNVMINFYVHEGSEDFVIINRRMAELLCLPSG